jgi:hypothetical protein
VTRSPGRDPNERGICQTHLRLAHLRSSMECKAIAWFRKKRSKASPNTGQPKELSVMGTPHARAKQPRTATLACGQSQPALAVLAPRAQNQVRTHCACRTAENHAVLTVLARTAENQAALKKKGAAGWLRGQTTLRRIHRRSDGGPERRQRYSDGGPEHRYEWYNETPPSVQGPNYDLISAQVPQMALLGRPGIAARGVTGGCPARCQEGPGARASSRGAP